MLVAGGGGGVEGWRDTKSKLFGEILKRDRRENSGAFSEGSLRAECACVPVRVHVCVCVRAGSTPGTFPPQLSPVY